MYILSFKMKFIFFTFWFICSCVTVIMAKHRNIAILDINSVCPIKKSCLDCLRFPQCSWCSTESKCFSDQLITQKGYCENATVRHIDYGMSLKENAVCSCAGGNMERNCVAPGAAQQGECSGRGQCICGRCFCESNPDPQNPTKAVMGEYCEYDNFSCDEPKCNEGPYNINELKIINEDNQVISEAEVSQPLEE